MKNGSCSATTVAGSAALPFVISTGEVMGRWPAQGDEKRCSSNYCRWKRRPSLCHLDRRSHGPSARPVMKNSFCSATTLNGSAALPFVLSTGEVMGRWPAQGDEKRVLFSNYCLPETPPFPLSSRPERSVVERSAVSAVLPWECFSTERTRISYFALLATSTCAALRRESHMQIINATGLHRKSGGAQWRDPR